MHEKIYFYRSKDPYYEFSNFYESMIHIDGKNWRSVEHYFQAAKFEPNDYRDKILVAPTPMEARSLGQTREVALREDWEEIKEQVMLVGLREKFANSELKALLTSTTPSILIENSPHDKYWGAGKSGNGRNRLGLLLMQVRAEYMFSSA